MAKHTTRPAEASQGIVTNTLWNLAGLALPMAVALVSIPLLIKGLGAERFGFLAVAWVVVGYFGLFDFGVGQALTRSLAELIARNRTEKAPELVWNAVLAHLALGGAGALVLAVIGPWLVDHGLRLSSGLRVEGTRAFLVLAASVPFIVLSSAFRGVLEASGRFDLVNAVRIPVSVLNYLAPLLILRFTPNLAAIVAVIAAGRAAACVTLWYVVVTKTPFAHGPRRLVPAVVKPLLQYGGWLTITNMVSPLLVSIDRLVISASISVAAVTFYVAPYEVISKLWVFSGALLGVLFPVFSGLGVERAYELPGLAQRARGVLATATLPFVVLVLVFSPELLTLWLGPAIAEESSPVARWLAIGIFANVLAQVPLTVLHAIGRADLTAKLLLIELPLYVGLAWGLAQRYGIVGVAAAWAIRALIDAAILHTLAARRVPPPTARRASISTYTNPAIILAFLAVFLALGFLPETWFWLKAALFAAAFVALCSWLWAYQLTDADRATVRYRIRATA